MKVGDYVRKNSGLRYEGFIVSVYDDLYGVPHADVQVPGEKGVEPYAGMIHVYPLSSLEPYKSPLVV